MLAGGCARVQAPPPSAPPTSPYPATAIAVSVLSRAVYLVDPATGRRTLVKGGLGHFQAGYAAWSPDRWRLAYGNDGIFLVDPRTGQEWTLTEGENLSMPAWSPDGRWLAYGDGLSLWLTRVDPFEPIPIHLRATLAPLGMTWQPGGAIAFQGLRRDCTESFRCTSTDKSEIWTVKPDGTALRRLTELGHAEAPRWSPDGARLLALRRLPGSVRREVWIVEANGSGATRLLGAADIVAADWSPAGDRLALVRTGDAPGTLRVWTANADGSEARPIGSSFTGYEATIDW